MTMTPPTTSPTARAYRASTDASRLWWEARSTLVDTYSQAVDALLRRYGITDDYAYIDTVDGQELISSTDRPRGCRETVWDGDTYWTPDLATEEGQILAEQIRALPEPMRGGEAERILGLPGNMPYALTHPDGTLVSRTAVYVDDMLYLLWEQEPATDLDLAVWTPIPVEAWVQAQDADKAGQIARRVREAVDRYESRTRHFGLQGRGRELLNAVISTARELTGLRDPRQMQQVRDLVARAEVPAMDLWVPERVETVRRVGGAVSVDPITDLTAILAELRAIEGLCLAHAAA